MVTERRYSNIKIHFDILESILKGRFKNAEVKNLPKDFKVIRVFDCFEGWNINFIVTIESKTFRNLQEGEKIPELVLEYFRKDG